MKIFDVNTGQTKDSIEIVKNSGLDMGDSECWAGKRVTHDLNLFVNTVENHLVCYDVRDNCSKPVYEILKAHSAPICDIDFNPNKPYSLCSGGEDCTIRFWDIRKSDSYLLNFDEDSHWVQCVKYNWFHD